MEKEINWNKKKNQYDNLHSSKEHNNARSWVEAMKNVWESKQSWHFLVCDMLNVEECLQTNAWSMVKGISVNLGLNRGLSFLYRSLGKEKVYKEKRHIGTYLLLGSWPLQSPIAHRQREIKRKLSQLSHG